MVEWIVGERITVTSMDQLGLSAADYADKEGYTELASWLRSRERDYSASAIEKGDLVSDSIVEVSFISWLRSIEQD